MIASPRTAFVCLFTAEKGAEFREIPTDYEPFRAVLKEINPEMEVFGCTPRKVGDYWVDVWYDDTCVAFDDEIDFSAMTNGTLEIRGGILISLCDEEGEVASITDEIADAIRENAMFMLDLRTGRFTSILSLRYD